MKNIIECQDKNGKVLKKEEGTENNPHPEDEPPFSRVATVDRDGVISVEDSRNNIMHIGGNTKLTKEQEEELNRNMRRMNQEFANRMSEFERNMQESMSNMQANMNSAFGENFPFNNNNPFGENFPFGNKNPFGDNFPFGNNFNPFANFHTFFYSPPLTATNFNGYVTGYYPYSSPYPNYPSTNSFSEFDDYYQQPQSKESDFSVEEFKPVYQYPSFNNQRTTITPTVNNFNDKYRYAYK